MRARGRCPPASLPGRGVSSSPAASTPAGASACTATPASDDVNFVLLGTGLAVCDGQEEPLEPGVCHICKKGSEHSIQNTGEGDLVLLTLVVERGEGRENDT